MVDAVKILRTASEDQLAVIGMGVDLPGVQSLESFLDLIYRGNPVPIAEMPWQAEGALSRAALNAIEDCAWDGARHQVIGTLIIGAGSNAAQVNGYTGVTGPVLDFTGYSEPLPAMLVQAHDWLIEHEVEAVVLAGSCLAEPNQQPAALFGFDQSVHRSQTGSGAAAVVIMRNSAALRLGLKTYALIDAMAYNNLRVRGNLQEELAACARGSLQAAGICPEQIGSLNPLACGDDLFDAQEIAALCAVYQGSLNTTAVGSGIALTGYMEGVNGLVSMIATGLCLVHRLRPGVKGWKEIKFTEFWSGSNFYIPTDSLTWFQNESISRRIAAINLIGKDGVCAHLILSADISPTRFEPVARIDDAFLIPIGGSTPADLIQAMEDVRKVIQKQSLSFPQAVYHVYQRYVTSPHTNVAVFLAHNSTETLRELEFGLRGIPAAIKKGSEWQTPGGSYYTPAPLGPDSKVAFVYPGAFNSYIGAGKDLFYLFPPLYDRFQEIAQDVGVVLSEEKLYPRSVQPLDKTQLDQAEANLLNDANAMMVSGSSLSVGLTMIFREIFQVTPYSSFGYSLGEDSMMFSLGVWGDGLHASQRLFASPLFHSRLAGPKNAVRNHWGLPALEEDARSKESLWENFLLMASADRVNEAISVEPKVYLTHVNTPRQVVIGGDPAACRRVIEKLKCNSLKAPFDYVLHCKAMESEYHSLFEIHSLPVTGRPDVKLFSAANDQPFILTQSEIARAVALGLCSPLDFPRLVETVYEDGARFFIELGAGSNCAKWIEEILRGKPFLSVSANRKGVDDATSILRVLARLVSNQIQVNLEPLYRNQVFHG